MDFTVPDSSDSMQQQIQLNYDRIRQEAIEIVDAEITHIKADEKLLKLLKH